MALDARSGKIRGLRPDWSFWRRRIIVPRRAGPDGRYRAPVPRGGRTPSIPPLSMATRNNPLQNEGGCSILRRSDREVRKSGLGFQFAEGDLCLY